ncbi:hypothetical protein D3C75_929010 [compost metagenome]
MNLHIAKVRTHVLVDKGEGQTLQFFADLDHRRNVAAQAQNVAAQAVQAADVVFLERVAQYALFQFFDLAVDGFADGLIVFGDEVEQGIEHEVLTMLQQQGSCFAALADQGVGLGVAVAAGDEVAVAGEDVGFDELQFALMAHRRISHDEQRVAKGFQLRPAVFFQGIFNGQFMQIELALQVG